MVLSTDLGRGAPRPEMVTATTALSASSFSGTTLNDLTFGSCELVTGSKSTGPTSPLGVWASAFAHNSTSALDRYFAFAARLSIMNAPPPSAQRLRADAEPPSRGALWQCQDGV